MSPVSPVPWMPVPMRGNSCHVKSGQIMSYHVISTPFFSINLALLSLFLIIICNHSPKQKGKRPEQKKKGKGVRVTLALECGELICWTDMLRWTSHPREPLSHRADPLFCLFLLCHDRFLTGIFSSSSSCSWSDYLFDKLGRWSVLFASFTY
ncbi:uncharacterized protein BO97DRAFT_132823 [Aspergillus homomorphus CBS 101889]|uniref:Uncharacterized protein n=1 Tax=Aspergillus homomorphus (strain CBS 101889) TaxID=1450537 RepID=A0A395I9D8_ASPHC|nr:hypothetical protein BO97DRAFT_132823 [Aspergillus homomorphus CBS 101889]RAL16399.1 hypothetical protein BO97DRAFT_132823 [Aspergillus homomorphus CBS 101889]